MTLSRSSGAVLVRDTAPAMPPATRWLHDTPNTLPFRLGKSGGHVSCSPMSIIYLSTTRSTLRFCLARHLTKVTVIWERSPEPTVEYNVYNYVDLKYWSSGFMADTGVTSTVDSPHTMLQPQTCLISDVIHRIAT